MKPTHDGSITIGDEQEPVEMTDAQNEQVDTMHHAAYDALCSIMGVELDWDMEWIGEACDALADVAMRHFGVTEMDIYPYIDEG